ncbi:rhodanese-related sulfurtransferase [Candidatus Mesenet endosymbiont of Phosphuga atrata]|uniref:oxygen-dependent tRNA uridine(34) hydroxylase TrhO n=1 Tax=Candidatus Mesenet endosymbiont of Phosphuga atrata TaxID=3066221 RepID=UPI0030CF9576
MKFVIATFYRFVELSNYYDMKNRLADFCKNIGLKGTILLAEEGINSTISGTKSAIDDFFRFLDLDDRLCNLKWQKTYSNFQPFSKMKVRLKKEIVTLGVSDLSPSLKGEYVEPDNWDNFISSLDVYVIDTRNEYEVKLGKFSNAINPNTQNFRDFPGWAKSWAQDKPKNKSKVAMYCTGGIRCEKSTTYMKSLGFKQVYHLKGGIINYLAKKQNSSNTWQGKCFVFDDRVAVNNSLLPSDEIKCISCAQKVTTDELKSVPHGQVICYHCKY